MNTVIVTRLDSEAPARLSVASISSKQRLVCAAKSLEMSLPAASWVAVWPASQMVRPPSEITAGENARLFWNSVPSRYSIFAAICGKPPFGCGMRPGPAAGTGE